MIFLIALEYAILASTFTIAKVALSFAKPFFLIGFRMTVAGSLLLGYLYFFNREKLAIKKSDYITFVKVSLFHVFIAFNFEFWALQYLTSSKTSIIYSTTPFFAAFLSYLLLGQKLNFQKSIAMAVGFFGLLPMMLPGDFEYAMLSDFFGLSLPEGVLLISVVSATYAWFLVSDLMKKGYSLLLINGVAFLGGGLASFGSSLIFDGVSSSPIYDFWPFLGWTLLLVLVANIISYNFYSWLLKHVSITFMTFAGFLCPIFGSLFGWFFLGESITWHHFAALALVTIGLTLFYRQELLSKKA